MTTPQNLPRTEGNLLEEISSVLTKHAEDTGARIYQQKDLESWLFDVVQKWHSEQKSIVACTLQAKLEEAEKEVGRLKVKYES